MKKTTDIIREQIKDNAVILYMKGNPTFPMCGFSGTAVAALKNNNCEFAYVDVLEHPRIMQGLPEVSDWPTFPQLFVKGELIGGSDIVAEMDKSGQLKTLLESADAIKG